MDNSMFKCNSDSSSESQQDQIIIERSSVVECKVEIQHLICSICHHVVWDAVSCGGVTGCHSAFCSQCIQAWLARDGDGSCPHCKRGLIRGKITPIMQSILNAMLVRCPNHSTGCNSVSDYPSLLQHLRSCPYKMKRCPGCKQQVTYHQFSQHTQNCDKFLVICDLCGREMPKGEYIRHHKGTQNRSLQCYSYEIEGFGTRANQIEQSLQQLSSQTSKLQSLTRCFLMGQPLQLYISFFTTFNQHFVFPNPTLIKPSFNQSKQKFDFLHFYIISPIYTNSIVSMRWSIKISKMVGNILLGFCSSMNINSLDYIVNKYGELKRKDINDNKYKIVRKGEFQFNQGDILRFKYVSLLKAIKIENESKRMEMVLGVGEVEEFMQGGKIYVFYSMDTLNDSISFIP